jgi:NADPH:quinone reductase-like Zn-dependent oxidoreductase
MRAAYYDRPGPAREVLKVGDVPTPEPAAGEVRVLIATSGVNPSDWKMRRGTSGRPEPFPRVIPHSDGAGTIDKVGAGVPAARVGERVWTWNARWQRAFGTAAEYCVLPAAQAVPLPETTDFAVGACLGIPALTAWQAIETDGGVAGQTVLVAGGAGAVGHYAIQFARLAGARRVIATISSAAKAAHSKAAGADETIDYKAENLAERVKAITDGRGVDRLVEVNLGVNAKAIPALMADHGLVAVYGSDAPEAAIPFGPNILKNIGYRFFIVYNQPPELRRRALDALTFHLRHRRLVHAVGARFPLERIAEAHEAVEAGAVIGNVVVDVA